MPLCTNDARRQVLSMAAWLSHLACHIDHGPISVPSIEQMHLHSALPKGIPPFCLPWADYKDLWSLSTYRTIHFISHEVYHWFMSLSIWPSTSETFTALVEMFVQCSVCLPPTNFRPLVTIARLSVSRPSFRPTVLWLQSLSINSLNVRRRGGWTDERKYKHFYGTNSICPILAKIYSTAIFDNWINVNCPAVIASTIIIL